MNCYKDDELKSILCYPRYDYQEFKKRVDYIDNLGIKLLKDGKTLINNCQVLGKGHAGVVVKGMLNDQEVVVKLKRMDSKRKDFRHEAEMLKIANKIGVGPKLFYANKDMIIMEYANGITIKEFAERFDIKYAIKDILEQCFRLDLINLDHGELSKLNKHVIIGEKEGVKIIDFDSASTNRRVSNVTSTAQYLLIHINEPNIFNLLREYKHCICRECFDKLLTALKVK